MPNSLVDDLESDVVCEELFDCIYGLPAIDEDCYRLLIDVGRGVTVDGVADGLDCGRTTAYRSVHRLFDAGLLDREQVNNAGGGYHYVYRAADPDDAADAMQRILNDWYAQTGQLIRDFRHKYTNRHAEARAAASNPSD